MKLPEYIEPCPIIDALVEIRFSTNTHPNAVFGLLYNSLKTDFEKVESLPILQLPEQVRINDKNLKYKPHYKISSKDYVVQIGPEVITISSFPQYLGWHEFSKKIYDVLSKIEQPSIIDEIQRVGIRYINFFNSNIFNNITLSININNEPINNENTVIRTQFAHESFNSTLQIANNAVDNNNEHGSIIDIDTFTTEGLNDFFSNKEEIINSGHKEEKRLFYSLLKKNFLDSLNPTYK